MSQSAICARTCFLSISKCVASTWKKQSPSGSTDLRMPSKRLARDLVSSSIMVVGEVVLYLGTSFVRAVRVGVAVGGSAACDALAAAAYVLKIVVLGEFLDNFGADWRIWKVSSVAFGCYRVW